MTIIRSSNYLAQYPIRFLGRKLVEAFDEAWSALDLPPSSRTMIFYLECFCHLHETKLTTESLDIADFRHTIDDFLSVITGNSLAPVTQHYKSRLINDFLAALAEVFERETGHCPEWLVSRTIPSLPSRNLLKGQIDKDLLIYWSGWPVVSRKNREAYLELACLYHTHGKKFTVEFFEQWRAYFAKRAGINMALVNQFSRFLSKNFTKWPAETFRNPTQIYQCFHDFMRDYFIRGHQAGLELNSRIAKWNTFVRAIEEAFFQPGVWPEPLGRCLPILQKKLVPRNRTKVSKNEDGIDVYTKLLTEVPLQVSDEKAIEILFNQIHKDLHIVEKWARAEARDLRRRQLRRKALAKSGKPIIAGAGGKSIEELGFSNVCATFESFGFYADNKNRLLAQYGGGTPRKEIAHALGIPVIYSLFPFMCLLVIDNPKITTVFLVELDLYNERGQLSGFVKTDAGYQLTGYKDRRKKHLSEQKLLLSPRSAALVRQVAQITQPLRDYLKNRNDDKWRKLFLTSGNGFSHPRAGVIPEWKLAKFKQHAVFPKLASQFAPHTDLVGNELKQFLCRVTLASIRASRGVQIYLRTQSVHAMADALGHAKYKHDLLSHYLPGNILSFFQSRWIRIFQKALICEALKDSPFLLHATEFSSMHELHEFLNNHALKNVPSILSNPQPAEVPTETNSDQILISIDVGVLTALLSLNRAVQKSRFPERISGLAKYWSDLSSLIEKEIVDGSDTLLKRHLEEAYKNLTPQKMEALIYELA